MLPITLRALAAQTDGPDQIVIVDDGSTDATAVLLSREHGLAMPAIGGDAVAGNLRWMRLPHMGKAAAMNRALPLIAAEVVMTVDADTLLAPGAVAEMRRAFAADATLVAATGILTPVCAPTMMGGLLQWFQAHEYLRNFLSRYAWMRQDGLLLISGAFAGFRRDAVLAVGGFDPDCLVEDYELIHRLRRHGALAGLGWTTAVLGRAQARTDAPATVGAFLRQRRRWFGGFLQTQFWYRDMVGNARYGRLGTRMLPIKAADSLQPIFGLSAFALLVIYAATGRLRELLPVGAIIGAKIVLDLSFYVWSVLLYRRWVGSSGKVRFGTALLAAIVEPFTFQILRHLGATLGWVSFLTGQMQWGRRNRGAAGADRVEVRPGALPWTRKGSGDPLTPCAWVFRHPGPETPVPGGVQGESPWPCLPARGVDRGDGRLDVAHRQGLSRGVDLADRGIGNRGGVVGNRHIAAQHTAFGAFQRLLRLAGAAGLHGGAGGGQQAGHRVVGGAGFGQGGGDQRTRVGGADVAGAVGFQLHVAQRAVRRRGGQRRQRGAGGRRHVGRQWRRLLRQGGNPDRGTQQQGGGGRAHRSVSWITRPWRGA